MPMLHTSNLRRAYPQRGVAPACRRMAMRLLHRFQYARTQRASFKRELETRVSQTAIVVVPTPSDSTTIQIRIGCARLVLIRWHRKGFFTYLKIYRALFFVWLATKTKVARPSVRRSCVRYRPSVSHRNIANTCCNRCLYNLTILAWFTLCTYTQVLI